jgi:hypothetical protein
LELTFKVGAKAKQLGRFFLDVADMCAAEESWKTEEAPGLRISQNV